MAHRAQKDNAYQVTIKDTNEQLDEEVHRTRSRSILSAKALSPWSGGTSPSWQMGMFTNLADLCISLFWAFRELHLQSHHGPPTIPVPQPPPSFHEVHGWNSKFPPSKHQVLQRSAPSWGYLGYPSKLLLGLKLWCSWKRLAMNNKDTPFTQEIPVVFSTSVPGTKDKD